MAADWLDPDTVIQAAVREHYASPKPDWPCFARTIAAAVEDMAQQRAERGERDAVWTVLCEIAEAMRRP